MRVVLTGGGTAGHITPALALADALHERHAEVLYAGTPQGIEATLVPEAGIPFQAFEAQGFNRSKPYTLITAVKKCMKSRSAAISWLKEIKPDCVVGFGGYVSIPVGSAALKLGIPVVVHEQNSIMGIANKYLSRKAALVCLTYAVAAEGVSGLENTKVFVTGNPVRRNVIEAKREAGREMLGVPQDATMLLVFGGSLGAEHINKAITNMKSDLLKRDNLYVVHVTGKRGYEETVKYLSLTPEEAQRYIVQDYQNRMGEALAAADMTVSRAGASSLAEIAARALPALLVPFPYATADHQTTNAQELVESGCAWLVADSQVETSEFSDAVLRLVDEPETRREMHERALSLQAADAARRLADVVWMQAHRRKNNAIS